jgi:RNA polymerase sigma-70 factor (ECF subfamily)
LTLKTQIYTDESLAADLVKGDERAITWFYEQSGPVLFTVTRRYASSQEEAEDFFHEGFLHILKKCDKYGGQSSLQTWAYRVMANFCINQLRKATAKIQWVDIEKTDLEDEADSFYEEDEQINMENLLEYMEQMPDGFRLVLNMYAVEGKSHAEIAGILGIAENTSKSQLFKARRWLKNKLKGNRHGEE